MSDGAVFPVIVELSTPEIYIASQVGIMRNIASCQRKLESVARSPDAHNDAQWSMDINGAQGELAVAKAFGVYWNASVNSGKAADVRKIQVRTTTWATGRLIIRPKDSDEDLFMLVHCRRPIFTLAGWMYGHEAKVEKFFREKDGTGDQAWWVDVEHLRKEALPAGVLGP